jgi:hypothetical protein
MVKLTIDLHISEVKNGGAKISPPLKLSFVAFNKFAL